MRFQYPQLLWLLFLPVVFQVVRSRRLPAAIPFPAADILRALPESAAIRLARFIPWLQVMALSLAFIALACPQLVNTLTTVTSKGIDIALAIDLSSSMLAVDRDAANRKKNRLTVAKEVMGDFMARRNGDRLAVVAFGARAYPVAPLTLDHEWLRTATDQLEAGSIEDGTALGDGLLAAVDSLRSSPATGRTVILITDGRANAGSITPGASASAAAALGIKVYTIGVGGAGRALFPVADPLGGVLWREVQADLDEAVLKDIAAITGGKYFRAEGTASLQAVFQEIDRLEKGTIEERSRRNVRELFPYFLLVSLLLLMLEQTLLSRRFGRVP